MNRSPPIRVMLVDDHAVVRYGFRMLLDSYPYLTVVAEAGSGEQAIQYLDAAAADVVVLDLSMSGIGGLERYGGCWHTTRACAC